MPCFLRRMGRILALTLTVAALSASPRFVMDGRFDDWRNVKASAAGGLGNVKAAALPGKLYLNFEFADERNLDRLDQPLRIAINADDSDQTGWTELGLEGVDEVLEIPSSAGIGAAVRRSPRGPKPDLTMAGDAGLLMAPTYSSKQFELRLDVPAMTKRAEISIAAGDTPVTTKFNLDVDNPGPSPEITNPFARPAGTDFRIVLWNVDKLRLEQQPDGFIRVLRAVGADIIFLSEVTVNASKEEIEERFKKFSPDKKWDLVLGTSGQLQRSVIAGRKDTDEIDGFSVIEYPAAGRRAALNGDFSPEAITRIRRLIDGGVSATAADTKVDEEHLLAIVADFTCCGRAGGSEDAIRQAEAEAINEHAKDALRKKRFRGVVIGGDLNLVATRKPLDDLRRGLDFNGEDLTVAEPMTVDSSANYTWRQPGALFPPGRLDYVVYTATTLSVVRAVVVETDKLDAGTRQRFSVEAGDTDANTSSDHLPVVVDFAFKRD